MVKALTFKGDKKPKKRKRTTEDDEAPSSKALSTTNASTEDAAEDDDNAWTSADALVDITGPVLLVLPTTPATCLATDSMGKVFASPIENMVEDSPSTAEPHLVSQVWVATRVVGSETDFVLKGHHGRYLGCDKYGILSAGREAISPEETLKFSAVDGQSGLFNIQTTRGTHITAISSSESESGQTVVRGDAEESSEKSHIRVRMQARFKPKHKVDKAEKVRSKISRKELEEEVGRKLDDHEAKKLKRARKDGSYHEALLDVKVKGKHDKFA